MVSVHSYHLRPFRALSRFEEGDYMSLRDDLERMPGTSLDTVGREQPKPRINWSPASLLEAAHKSYLRGLTLCETTTDFNNDM